MIATLGEILIRLCPPNAGLLANSSLFESHYGGSESNIAVNLATWKKTVRLISAVAENELSIGMIEYYKGKGIDTRFLQRLPGRNGLYFLENGLAYRTPKVIYDREDSVFSQLEPKDIDWNRALEGITWFHWSGITPALSLKTAQLCQIAINEASKKGIFISTDLNIRSKLWNYGKSPSEIMPSLLQSTQLLLGDPFSFQSIFKTKVELKADYFVDDTKVMNIFEQLSRQIPSLKAWGMTLRKVHHASYHSISGILYDKKQIIKAKKYDVQPIIGRVGGGDAFMSGLINGIYTGMSLQKTIEFATAAAVLKNSTPGDILGIEEEAVLNLINDGEAFVR